MWRASQTDAGFWSVSRLYVYFGDGSEGAGAKGATELIASSTPDWVFALRNSKAPTMTAKNKSAIMIGVRFISYSLI